MNHKRLVSLNHILFLKESLPRQRCIPSFKTGKTTKFADQEPNHQPWLVEIELPGYEKDIIWSIALVYDILECTRRAVSIDAERDLDLVLVIPCGWNYSKVSNIHYKTC